MSTPPPLSVLFFWHQHQPLYKDALADRYELPWVRLHAAKDYVDMAALLEEFPTLKANFNLVPSLLIQLDDYAHGKSSDKFIDLTLKRAADLSFEEKQFLLQNFFMAHWENMVDPYPRYRELLDKRGRTTSPDSLSRAQTYYKEQDWRDLQAWFNLTWIDPLWREKDPVIGRLCEKGRNFTEDDKRVIIEKHRELCSQVVSKHKELQDKGQIEVTTTPFYHPILPLLCDSEAARVAMPHAALPQHRFQHLEDARLQVRRAVDDYQNRFGRTPAGMWPAEGSVSEEAARIFIQHGVRWVATDEGVLAHSLPGPFHRDDLYEPYRLNLGDGSLHFFFRDHELSDAIGFVYASWDPEVAAEHFIKRLHDIRQRLLIRDGATPHPHIVSVILDGENCWEYYANDGIPFLRALYRRLAQDPLLETVRASDFLDRTPQAKPLPKLWAGSWINSNFAIWIGHAEDNKAWDLLSRTRQFLAALTEAHPERAGSLEIRQAWEEIYIAEGSDRCWWYGEDHSSANDDMFDYLFRKHLMNVYSLAGEKVPEDLHLPIKRKRTKSPIHRPTDFITPVIDGKVTNYYEWHCAGSYETEAGGTGTMHKSGNLIKTIYFGFDLSHLYFRLDTSRPLAAEAMTGTTITLTFFRPEGHELTVTFEPQGRLALSLRARINGAEINQQLTPGYYGKVIEFAVPLKCLQNPDTLPYELFCTIHRDQLEQECWPVEAMFQIPYPVQDVFVENWVI